MALLNVKLFAVVRDRLGRDSETVDVTVPIQAAELLRLLTERYPDLAGVFRQCRVAVNRVFVAPEHVVRPEDEVAVIPPVAGG